MDTLYSRVSTDQQDVARQDHALRCYCQTLGLRDPQLQALIADKVVRQGLTVRATEKLIQAEQQSATAGKSGKSGSDSGKSTSTPRDSAAAIQRIQANLRHKLATSVNVHHGEKKGKIEIEYYGNDDLGRLLDLLGVSAE